ncbi:MAG: NUDIX domain-containing protein [Candidatus Abawacabacteria bacterium]|nr:NUDIX domain-containing protein [Candidatus Abawacabacteria bacterium]
MYRPNVAAVVVNHNKEIMICKRNVPQEHWQFPQGGVDEGETEEQAVLRELQEELGSNKFSLLYKSKNLYRYEWPGRGKESEGDEIIGQEQRFFLVLFWGVDSEIELEKGGRLTEFKWVQPEVVVEKIYPARKSTCEAVLKEFAPILKVAST